MICAIFVFFETYFCPQGSAKAGPVEDDPLERRGMAASRSAATPRRYLSKVFDNAKSRVSYVYMALGDFHVIAVHAGRERPAGGEPVFVGGDHFRIFRTAQLGFVDPAGSSIHE